MRRMIAGLILVILCTSSASAFSAPTNTGALRKNVDFDLFVNESIKQLSESQEYSEWSKASWRRAPLGAGMRGWIVLLAIDGREVGYLVISDNENGQFVLTEYSKGESPY